MTSISSLYKLRDWIDINNLSKDKISWYFLSQNPNVISLLEQNFDKINWNGLSRNPNAIHLLEKNMDKINWMYLSRNLNAIPLLENNVDNICWNWFSKNPNIFELDYGFLKGRMDIIREELMMKAWHPSRVMKWLEAGLDMEDF